MPTVEQPPNHWSIGVANHAENFQRPVFAQNHDKPTRQRNPVALKLNRELDSVLVELLPKRMLFISTTALCRLGAGQRRPWVSAIEGAVMFWRLNVKPAYLR